MIEITWCYYYCTRNKEEERKTVREIDFPSKSLLKSLFIMCASGNCLLCISCRDTAVGQFYANAISREKEKTRETTKKRL